MESVQELKTEMEAVRKTQSEGRLDMENLGKRTETTESILTNRIQEIEELISDYEDNIEKINALTKENSKSNKFSSQNIQEIWDIIKKTKSKNNRGRRKKRIADQKSRKYIQQNYRRKLSHPKEGYYYEGARSIQNTEQTGSEKNIPSPYNNLKNDIPIKVQEAYRTLNRLDQKKSPCNIIIKTQNIQIKERI